jgi:hypothetical protein
MAVRPVLLVGGAPRIAIDAIRHLTVGATGGTCLRLADLLRERGQDPELLLSLDSVRCDAHPVQRYERREQLDDRLRAWIARHPDGAVVMAAAVNDYQLGGVEVLQHAAWAAVSPAGKIPSGAEEIRIRLTPAAKLIDQLHGWGLRGPLAGFKHEAPATVVASAQRLRGRVNATAILANALDGSVQALVTADGVQDFGRQRDAALQALAALLVSV